MKKNVLLLINGFGIERTDSHTVYTPELMPNMDRLTKENVFVSIPNKFLDYKSGYRNFSMGINNPLTYSLIENEIINSQYNNNQLLKYILAETTNLKSRLHIFCFWDSDKTFEHLVTYLKSIQSHNISRIFVHVVLCQQSIESYKEIERGLNSISYDVGGNVKLGVVTGENNFYNLLACKDLVKNFVTEFGEKWKDLPKKIEVQIQTRTTPNNTRTFSVNPTYKFENNDQILIFNYNNIDLKLFRQELLIQKYRQIDLNTIKFYSLFPVRADIQFPFMYNYAVSANYTLDTLKQIKANCLILDKSDKCSYINYYLTGLRNTVDDDLKYISTDNDFIYDSNQVLNVIKTYDRYLYIINYEIDSCKMFEDIQERLKKIDVVIGEIEKYCKENNMGLFISSLYGFERMMYNKKQELLKINLFGKVPVLIVDSNISLSTHTVAEGSLFDLANSIFKNINPDYKMDGLIKKKSSLLSIFYKKPKEAKKK